VLGNHFAEPVFLLRFATRHPIWFLRGSRSLGHDYLPPSSGGDPNLQGSWDVIHFNWGVWDAGWKDKSSKYYQGHGNTTSVADFEQNLRTLVARMKQTGATLIWASVTPVWKGEPDKPNADVVAYNAVAEKVMKENGVIINDLNALVPKGTGSWVSPDVHAVGNLAPQVIQTIRAALASRPKKTKPLPRVLLIGDSITGSYQEAVMKNLDGEAAVFKNPGNAESTWTGLKRIDEWLDLKRYLQNGQEYLELVNSVNDSLAQLPRFLPGYQNQGYEIAGLVWMQGIADSGSPAHAAAYEKNLANLIRDLRRDLKAPKMPVVVAALKMGDGKVYDAQRAVGETARYPEFFGNVTVVDTQPFFCGGDPRTLGSHAETILEVGETLGQSLLKLMEVK
jgi:lysophospholipase L1-like esterase